ncbi:MAG: Phosphate-binding protein PstS 1 precursor [Pelotomaculum sp. PtaU1.Bin035]|nr:MAG: Phosphate-binding protein PstS 1 precursor [Pelotomaculum sp. PtaU1.Bin035]
MRNNRRCFIAAAILAVMLMVAGCGKKDAGNQGAEVSGKVSASGSTALLPLVKQAEADFKQKYTAVDVSVSGGGSFTGLNQVASGAVDIGNSDVPVTPELKDKGLVEHQVSVIPFIIVANPGVELDSLTQDQLIDIFTGKFTNWKQLGGKDQAIIIIGRSSSSGSRAAIKEIVLKGQEFSAQSVVQDSNGAVRAAISNTPGAIGYIDQAYVDKTVKPIKYNGVDYSVDNVASGKYPIYTYGRMYTKGEAEGAVKAFIEFIQSDDFQNEYVSQLGFVPINKMKK